MELLLPVLAALRYTDALDWYAARRVSVAEALIAAGFDEHASTGCRLADGRIARWTRRGVATFPPARESRRLILAVIGKNAVLGAGAGFVVLFAPTGLLNLAQQESAGGSRAPGRGYSVGERRPGFIEELPRYGRDGPGSATPVMAALAVEVHPGAATGHDTVRMRLNHARWRDQGARVWSWPIGTVGASLARAPFAVLRN